MRGELVSLPGQALAAQTLSIKGREDRVEEGSDVLICAFTRDHDEESLPLPRGGWRARVQVLVSPPSPIPQIKFSAQGYNSTDVYCIKVGK